MLREIISWPISVARTAVDLPRAMDRSIREANEVMVVSREQLEVMRRQADDELLGRVVRLTEPLERAQRSGEYAAERLKRAIFGPEEAAQVSIEAEIIAEETALAEQGEAATEHEASPQPPESSER